jgi:hypothetical protein
VEDVTIIAKIRRIVLVRPSKGHNGQLLCGVGVIADRKKAVRAATLGLSCALEKQRLREADITQDTGDFDLVEGKPVCPVTVRQARHLGTKSCLGCREATRKELSALARKVQVVPCAAIRNRPAHRFS